MSSVHLSNRRRIAVAEADKPETNLINKGKIVFKEGVTFAVDVEMQEESLCILELVIFQRGKSAVKREFNDLLPYREIPARHVSVADILGEVSSLGEIPYRIKDKVIQILNGRGFLSVNSGVLLDQEDRIRFEFKIGTFATHVDFENWELLKVVESNAHKLCRCRVSID